MIYAIYDAEGNQVNLIVCESKELAEQLTGMTAVEVTNA